MKSIRSSLIWIVFLLAAWLMLTAGDLPSLMIGLPFIALALLLKPSAEDKHGKPELSLNMVGLSRYAYFFMIESLRGGIDVCRRVLARKTLVSPDFFEYPMQLQLSYAQQLFISSIGLLPGTLCADRKEDQLYIHTLDHDTDTTKSIKKLESLVGQIFGESL